MLCYAMAYVGQCYSGASVMFEKVNCAQAASAIPSVQTLYGSHFAKPHCGKAKGPSPVK